MRLVTLITLFLSTVVCSQVLAKSNESEPIWILEESIGKVYDIVRYPEKMKTHYMSFRQDIDLMDNEGHLDGGPANFDFLLKDFSGTSNIWGGSLPDREPSDEELGLAHCSLTVWRSQLFGQKLYRNTDPVISKESKWELTKLLRPVPWLGYKYQLNRVSEGDINYNSPQEVILHCWKADTYSGDSPNPAGNPTNAELVRLLYGIFKFTGK